MGSDYDYLSAPEVELRAIPRAVGRAENEWDGEGEAQALVGALCVIEERMIVSSSWRSGWQVRFAAAGEADDSLRALPPKVPGTERHAPPFGAGRQRQEAHRRGEAAHRPRPGASLHKGYFGPS